MKRKCHTPEEIIHMLKMSGQFIGVEVSTPSPRYPWG
jgi:hypothetical protein